MAHHLAEKLALEKAARGAVKKQLSDECAELILKVWTHRHSMPDGTRPLGSFEPIFRSLQELASGDPRNSYFRAVPSKMKIKAPKEIEKYLSLAMTIDSAANTLIRYTLAEAVATIPAKDKRWTKLRAAIAPRNGDIQIVVRLIELETLVDEKQKLEAEAVKDLEEMIAALRILQKMARELRAQLSTQSATLAASVTRGE
jgi:hypothetical protein